MHAYVMQPQSLSRGRCLAERCVEQSDQGWAEQIKSIVGIEK
jgi:hypothetical protein